MERVPNEKFCMDRARAPDHSSRGWGLVEKYGTLGLGGGSGPTGSSSVGIYPPPNFCWGDPTFPKGAKLGGGFSEIAGEIHKLGGCEITGG